MVEPPKTGSVWERLGAKALGDDFDWVGHTEAVADAIFGVRNESMSRPPKDVRYGNKGSVSINLETGEWYDFENERGGGVKDLIRVHTGIEDRAEIIAYAKACLNGEKTAANGGAGTHRQNQSKGNGGKSKNQNKRHETTYTYHDADGRVTFEVVRSVLTHPDGSDIIGIDGKRLKTFSQRRPSGEADGSWLWSISADEFMRSGPAKDWISFSETKFNRYPTRTRQRKRFDTPAPVLPYRLPELLKALAANQTICIAEGENKVGRIRDLGFTATCNAGGAKKWSAEHTPYLKDADVVLLPDNDEVGHEHMEAIAKSLSAVAKRVRILHLPGLPDKGDVVDWRGSAEEFARLVASAPEYIRDENTQPQPLMRPVPPPEPFPVDALGPGLADAARAICDIVQAPIEMGAGAVLASASLALSAHIDIELPTGQTKPLSDYFWCIAQSGERKSSVDDQAFFAQKQREQELRAHHVAELEKYRVAHTIWEAKAKAIAKEYQKVGAAGSEAHQKELEQLGPEPIKPLDPLIMSAEFTLEGMVRCLKVGQPLYGIIGSEGGQFVGGHGMTDDAKLRTISGLSAAWDGDPIKRVRADETIILCGRRVGMHLMVQPEVAAIVLGDELIAKQGFLSRILMCAPESLIGTRMHKTPPPEAAQILQDYNKRILAILKTPYPLVEDTQSELHPREVPFSAEAEKLFWQFADEVEKEMAAGGEYELIRSFAAKLPEHAARMAAVIAGYQDLNITELGRDDFVRGMHIVSYYAREAKRIFSSSWANPSIQLAQKLLDWLVKDWRKPTIAAREIYTYGPNAIRDRETALALANILDEHGWLKLLKKKRHDQREWQIWGRQ